MNISQAMTALGPGASIAYVGKEGDHWHCDIKLPQLHYTVSLVMAEGATPDDALQNAVTRALTMFAKEQEGDKVA